MVDSTRKICTRFKAYTLTKDKDTGLSLVKHVRIGRFQDVCFIGSNVLTMPDSVNYNYRYMSDSFGYPSL